MKTKIKEKIEWAKQMIEMHTNEFKIDCKQKHIRRINELNGMIEGLESLL